MSSISFKSKRGLPDTKTGFTLVEMMVVVAIFMITTGIVLSNFKGFSRKSSLDLLAREISLVIRQAQVYGSATKLYEGTDQFPSYGVYVSGNNATSFKLFADRSLSAGPPDGIMEDYSNCDKKNECAELFNLTGGVVISSVQGCGADETDCKPIGTAGLNILFQRPKLGASFNIKCSAGDCPDTVGLSGVSCSDPELSGISNCNYSSVKITLKDTTLADNDDNTRDIMVWNTGHIYVNSELGEHNSTFDTGNIGDGNTSPSGNGNTSN